MGSGSRDPSFSLTQETSVLLEFSAAVSGNLRSRFRARPSVPVEVHEDREIVAGMASQAWLIRRRPDSAE